MMSKASVAIIGIGAPEDSVFLDGNFLKIQDIGELRRKGVGRRNLRQFLR
jgi:DNA-binding transcriptional regulator LsrR (DeoR family)